MSERLVDAARSRDRAMPFGTSLEPQAGALRSPERSQRSGLAHLGRPGRRLGARCPGGQRVACRLRQNSATPSLVLTSWPVPAAGDPIRRSNLWSTRANGFAAGASREVAQTLSIHSASSSRRERGVPQRGLGDVLAIVGGHVPASAPLGSRLHANRHARPARTHRGRHVRVARPRDESSTPCGHRRRDKQGVLLTGRASYSMIA